MSNKDSKNNRSNINSSKKQSQKKQNELGKTIPAENASFFNRPYVTFFVELWLIMTGFDPSDGAGSTSRPRKAGSTSQTVDPKGEKIRFVCRFP